jgi:ribosomal protein L11 methyltransferase
MRSSPLWQVCITTSFEAEEAVSAFVEHLLHQPPSVYTDEEAKTAVVSVYSPKRAVTNHHLRQELRAGFKEIGFCGLNTDPGTITIRRVRRVDWASSWKRHFKPLEIGQDLLVKPSWSRRKAHEGQAVVVLDPGLSFGTGQHPTTLFCLEQLVIGRRTGRSLSFLDIGTGSGILAVAATKLGYRPVEAFDFDPVSVRAAKANATRNGLRRRVRFSQRDLTRVPLRSKTRFDVICANLTADLLVGERDRIINRLKPDGVLVLAGILTSQFCAVSTAYKAAGLKLIASSEELEWHSASFRPAA